MVNQYVLKVYPLGLGNEVYRTLEICGDSCSISMFSQYGYFVFH